MASPMISVLNEVKNCGIIAANTDRMIGESRKKRNFADFLSDSRTATVVRMKIRRYVALIK